MKKKLRLRKEVKQVLAIGIALIIILILIGLIKNQKNEAIDQCVNAGHSYSYCESGLR